MEQSMWRDRRVLDLFRIELPILQSPMGGASGPALAIAVSEAGGLGALAGAVLTIDRLRADIGVIQQQTSKSFNMNFFAYRPEAPDANREEAWRRLMSAYYAEAGLAMTLPDGPIGPQTFSEAMCEVVEDVKPAVVSFHFGLPPAPLLARVKSTGASVISSATTVAEARYLEDAGVDAIIAQGLEAGGHRGMFLTSDLWTQMGTLALVPQVVDAVKVPVIAAGGIADGRGLAAVLALGASAAQVGTAFLPTPEAQIPELYSKSLAGATNTPTAETNVFTGKPARVLVNRLVREAGPISDIAPVFPEALRALAPLRAVAEAGGSSDFTPMWAGQGAALGRAEGAADLLRTIAAEAEEVLARLAP
jgi:nitronate monooxygenase